MDDAAGAENQPGEMINFTYTVVFISDSFSIFVCQFAGVSDWSLWQATLNLGKVLVFDLKKNTLTEFNQWNVIYWLCDKKNIFTDEIKILQASGSDTQFFMFCAIALRLRFIKHIIKHFSLFNLIKYYIYFLIYLIFGI